MENPFLELILGQITLKSHFYMIQGPFNVEKSLFLMFFPLFSSFLHWQRNMVSSYDINQYPISQSSQDSVVPEEK